jgi:hypothetical protein
VLILGTESEAVALAEKLLSRVAVQLLIND